MCEDGGGPDLLRGVTPRGEIFDFAKLNSDNTSELAGATFDPDGEVLFFNVQTPGITFAVTGPWDRTQRRDWLKDAFTRTYRLKVTFSR